MWIIICARVAPQQSVIKLLSKAMSPYFAVSRVTHYFSSLESEQPSSPLNASALFSMEQAGDPVVTLKLGDLS